MTTRPLPYLYALASLLPARAAVASAQHDADWYALGFATVGLLLLAAAAREHLNAEERRAVGTGAERLARLRADAEAEADADAAAIDGIARLTLAGACCELWWTSAGTDHDTVCGRDRWAA